MTLPDTLIKDISRKMEGLGIVSFSPTKDDAITLIEVLPYPHAVFFEYSRCLVRIVDTLHREYKVTGCVANTKHVQLYITPVPKNQTGEVNS